MATSDRNGFLTRTGHLVGSGAAVAGLAGGFLAHAPVLLSVGLGAAAYAAGFLLTPRPRPVVDPDGLESVVRGVRDAHALLERCAAELGAELVGRTADTLVLLEELVRAWPELRGSAADRWSVEAIATDHLPTVLRNHLDLPAALRSDAALEQVGVLNTELVRIRDDVHRGALERVRVQGGFLRDRYGREDPWV